MKLLIFLLLLVCVSGRGIWGSRRKAEEEPSAPDLTKKGKGGSSGARRQQAQSTGMDGMGGSGLGAVGSGLGGMGGLGALGSMGSMGGLGAGGSTGNPHVDELMDKLMAGLDGLLQMIDSDEFADIVTPEMIKETLMNVPGIQDHAEVLDLLDSPAFQEPDMLKATLREGISTLKVNTYMQPCSNSLFGGGSSSWSSSHF